MSSPRSTCAACPGDRSRHARERADWARGTPAYCHRGEQCKTHLTRRGHQGTIRESLLHRLGVGDPVVISDFDEPEPDLCVLLHPVELRKIVPADVALLIEVSDRSYDYDQGTKLPRYLATGIPNVWLVNLHDHARPRLERYALGSGDRLEQSSGQVAVPSAALVLDLDALFAGLEALPSDEYEPHLP